MLEWMSRVGNDDSSSLALSVFIVWTQIEANEQKLLIINNVSDTIYRIYTLTQYTSCLRIKDIHMK